MRKDVVLITGSSRGIGLEVAVMFAKQGATVYATMRDITQKEALLRRAKQESIRLQILALDVTDERTICKAISTITQKHGRIDILVNNAGYGLFGPISELPLGDIRAQYETNVFGLIRCMQLCVPHMPSGSKILNISSVVGHMGIPMMGAYCSSKFAVEGITESARRELFARGIYVTAIEPGSTVTDFGGRSLQVAGDRHSTLFKKGLRLRERMLKKSKGDSARFVAKDIVRIAKKKIPALRYSVGLQGRAIRILQRLLPDAWVDAIFRLVLWIS